MTQGLAEGGVGTLKLADQMLQSVDFIQKHRDVFGFYCV